MYEEGICFCHRDIFLPDSFCTTSIQSDSVKQPDGTFKVLKMTFFNLATVRSGNLGKAGPMPVKPGKLILISNIAGRNDERTGFIVFFLEL
jgi:hypothetical protein